MPSTSPGSLFLDAPTAFSHILPGAPTESLQATATFIYRFKRYVAYISGKQLNVLNAPNTLVQAVTFKHDLVAIAADADTGKLCVTSKKEAWVLEPLTEGWTKVWWEKSLLLRREDEGDEARWLSWGNEGELLVAGNRVLSLFSTGPASRTTSPRTSAIDEETYEERRALWSKPVASPLRQAEFSPSSSLIATCSDYDRLVKIWRRLSFEDGLFDHTYLPHPGAVTHLQWRPMDDNLEERRTSGISRRHEEEPEVLYTIANDGVLRVWRTGGAHHLDILILHTSIDLVAAIPDSPSVSAKGNTNIARPARYAVTIPCTQFTAAVNAALGIPLDGKISHSKEFLKELVSKDLDVIIAFDGQGRMSAWGLQSIGHKRRPETPTQLQPYHIAHAEGLMMKLTNNTPAMSTCWFQDDRFHLLSHGLGKRGEVSWWQGTVETFFSPSAPGADRLSRASKWTGAALSEWAISQRHSSIDLRAISTKDDDEVIHAIPVTLPFDPSQNCIVSVTRSGVVAYSLVLEGEAQTSFEPVATFATEVSEPGVFAASAEFAALLSQDLRSLTIVDLTDGYLEHQQQLNSTATHLKCFTSSPRHNFVAVGSDTVVDILAQGPYQDHVWQTVKRVSIAGLGLQLEHVAWTLECGLALAAGNGIFISEPEIDPKQLDATAQQRVGLAEEEAKIRLPDFSQRLKRPLPVWHPSLLADIVRHGHYAAALTLIAKLARQLKFYSSGDELSPVLEEDIEALMRQNAASDTTITKEMVDDLKEQLDEKELPFISSDEQKRLANVVDTVLYVKGHATGLDTNALAYLFEWKLQLVHHDANTAAVDGPMQSNGMNHEFVPEMQWREITLAYHSATQQPLLDILVLHHDNKMTWHAARLLGVTSWLRDRQALESVFEQLGQTSYRSSQPPDPVNASIYYLALHKKATLLALWRIATWHREQRTTANFLKRDFNQAEAKTAAKKNAYALMGKRRFHYSAAFFLLADDPASAINVLAGQCEDVGFAIAVARLYCGDGSSVLYKLLVDRVIPQAEKDRNRWLLSWCYSVFNEPVKAAETLVEQLGGIRKWTQDDPTTLLLYKQLRKTPSENEYDAILRAARVLRKKGEWLLALDLVQSWEFKGMQNQAQPTQELQTNGITNGIHEELPDRTVASQHNVSSEPPSLLDSFAEPKPAQPVDEKAAREAKAAELLAKLKAKKEASTTSAPPAEKKKPEPTQFKEPDANSLLDTFGF
ncbi:Regulator of V-ATPase in vacuolar membrane protein 1 [Pseudocercospora fuligena]|uniref:Regulator of V-ATPase in vacuolar membrane protein 1 n=1 Tax=Pseudocercospora fuligena TaxID=685502 RepID=A0A8H6RCG8_9PEZI|nr:Regulator of V-ATPase in vacuolar membrane protein 1 [Pseudocercospora fuligena]